MCHSFRFARWSLGAILLLSTGCSSEMSDAIVEAARAQSHGPKFPSEQVSPKSEGEGKKLVSMVAMPSPERTNPFEMSGVFEEAPIGDTIGKKREIRVIGFIELDTPAAMLSLDGRTQIFKAGETFDKVTVQEILPPRVRVSCDGVTWQASLFDPRGK